MKVVNYGEASIYQPTKKSTIVRSSTWLNMLISCRKNKKEYNCLNSKKNTPNNSINNAEILNSGLQIFSSRHYIESVSDRYGVAVCNKVKLISYSIFSSRAYIFEHHHYLAQNLTINPLHCVESSNEANRQKKNA